MSEKIIGRNAVTEALNSDREIEKIILAKGAEGSIKKIEGKAKAKKIPLYYSDKSRMDRMAATIKVSSLSCRIMSMPR